MKEQGKTIGSVIDFGDAGDDTGENVGVEGASNVTGKKTSKMNMAHNEDVLVDLYKRIYSNPDNLNATCVAPDALPGRVQK